MAQKAIQQGPGLWLETHALESPPGSLRQCDDVLLHRPGMIGPRFGLGVATGVAARSTTYRPVKIIPWGQDLVISSHLPATGYRLERGSVDTQYVTGAGGAPPATGYEVDAFQSRSSLYLALDTAVRKLTSASATIANAGLDVYYTFPRVTQVAVGAGADKYAIDDTAAVAYRVVWVSEDANGYIRRSAPGERYVVSNVDANRKVVRFDRIYLQTWSAAGDLLEIYRTVNVSPQSATPSTEYQLAITHTVTSAEVSAGYIAEDTIEDDVTDANLGAFLYTNPSQGGILQANEPPPKANTCAWWNSFAWYGNSVDRHRLELEIAAVFTTDAEFDVVGMHGSTFTGDFTSGSAIIQNVNRVDGMMVGQYVTDSALGPTQAGTNVPAETQITKVQTRIQVVNASISDGDTFALFGVTFTMRAAPSGATEVQIGASDSATAINVVAAINNLALTSWLYPIDPLAVHVGTGLFTIEESTAGHGVEFTRSDAAAFQPDIAAGRTTLYNVTMDANASATNATATAYDCDWISVNGTTFYVFQLGGASFRSTSAAANVANPTYRLIAAEVTVGEMAISFARAMSAYTRLTSSTLATWGYRDIAQWTAGERADGWFLLSRALGTNTAITVQALRGASLRPNAATALESESGARINRLHWSRIDEPEAVPLLNFADVGPRNFAIRKLVPLEDALLVWTDRGLYRVTGVGGVWRIDPVSSEIRLLHAECVAVLRDVCYAWTDRGMVSVTGQGGIEIVSGPVGAALRDAQRLLPEGTTGDNRGFYMWAHARLGLVGLALANATSETLSQYWYVLHQGPGAWARWVRTDRCAVYSSGVDALRTGSPLSHWSIRGERVLLETPGIEPSVPDKLSDINLSALTASCAASVVTIATAAFSPYTPAIGDVLTLTAVNYRITAVNTSGANYLLTVDGTPSGVSAEWYQAIVSTLLWQSQTIGSPGIEGHWQEMQLHLQAHSGLATSVPVTVGGQIHLGTSPSTVTATVIAGSQVTRPVRVGLPREVARSPHFAPYVQVKTAGAYWQLGPVVLDVRPVGRMVAR